MSYCAKLFRLDTNLFSTNYFRILLLTFLVLPVCDITSIPYLYIPTLLPYLSIQYP